MSKRAIIIGATGLVGGHLLQDLLADDHFSKVIVLGRRSCQVQHKKLEEILINFDDTESYKDFVKGDVLFSCLGTTIKKAGTKEVQWKIDYTYQLEMAQIAKENEVNDYVLVSSSGADPKSKVFYSRMKGELEEAIKELQFSRIQIFQPSLLLGQREEERMGEKIGEWLGGFLTKFIFKKYRPIKGSEVALAMKNAYLKEDRTSLEMYELDEIFSYL